MQRRALTAALAWVAAAALHAQPVRMPVLQQIELPHGYYYRELYLPQLTSGPSWVCWMPDGQSLVYSMQGTLWRQRLGSEVAEQLTDDAGADYQPDCSPDGRSVAFVRYDGRSLELMHLDLGSGEVRALTADGAVSVEPRWSPDGRRLAFVSTAGTGHFLLQLAAVEGGRIQSSRTLVADRRSSVARYYYSAFDHAINPTWTRDGRELVFVSNREVAHGTGDIVRLAVDGDASARPVLREETSWHARPDVSADGSRIVYSSYLGRQWQQLWLLPVEGGYPFPLTYGDYDNTNPRWSPDGRSIAFISNRDGNTALWLVDALSGGETPLRVGERRYLRPHRALSLRVQDEAGRPLPSRISVVDGRQRFYAPHDAWIHADDLIVREQQRVETRYFHGSGEARLEVPHERLAITVSRGPEYEVVRLDLDAGAAAAAPVVVTLKRLALPPALRASWSGDLHVHMNYGGHYHNTPARLVQQARAEDVDLVYNLVVNKEQRIPDIAAFRTGPDPASTEDTLLLHGQEYHSSYWGHLALLNLTRHLLLPDYTAYPFTAVASPYPHNAMVADLAHAQSGLVAYVHPFATVPDPQQAESLTNALPVDAALGKVDYYEAVGFADHLATSEVWYRLLECGIRLPAGAGTDFMANYASLRGPVGLNRVYVPAEGALSAERFLAALKQGRGVATNGPLLALRVMEAQPGDTLRLKPGTHSLAYRATLRANFPVDHLELVSNGKVVAHLDPGADGRQADVQGSVTISESSWILLRAWSDGPRSEVLDIYPYATTSPVYVDVGDRPRRSRAAADYFLSWLGRLQAATEARADYRTPQERAAVLGDIARAKDFYEACQRDASEPRR